MPWGLRPTGACQAVAPLAAASIVFRRVIVAILRLTAAGTGRSVARQFTILCNASVRQAREVATIPTWHRDRPVCQSSMPTGRAIRGVLRAGVTNLAK